jgi:hypothetical protein
MRKFNANIKYILALGWFKYVNIKILENNKLTKIKVSTHNYIAHDMHINHAKFLCSTK